MNKAINERGFTLIEILVVIGIIAILSTIVIIAINPARQFAQARNAQRVSNINTILNAVGQRMVENRGMWTAQGGCPASLPANPTIIGSGSGNINLASCIVPIYVSTMIWDPSEGNAASTGYRVFRDSAGRTTVDAPYAELGETVTISR